MRLRLQRIATAAHDRWQRTSLRTRMTALAAAAVAVAVLAVSAVVFLVAGSQLRGQFDEKLLAQARNVERTLEVREFTRNRLPASQVPLWDDEGDSPLVQIVAIDGRPAVPDRQRVVLPVTRQAMDLMEGRGNEPVYQYIRAGGERYRMVTIPFHDGLLQFARRPADVEKS
jgi:two-component system sensor histidine kinase MprB